MQTLKHTGSLWNLYSKHRDEQYIDIALPTPLEDGTTHKAVFQIVHKDSIPDEEAEANAILISNASWYRVLALLAVSGGMTAGITSVNVPRMNDSGMDPGWCLTVDDKSWAWMGGLDGFGVPVPPPQAMFQEIKEAIENL